MTNDHLEIVDERLSVPPRTAAVRSLTEEELVTVRKIADVLIPRAGTDPAATETSDFDTNIEVALNARADAYDEIVAILERCAAADSPDSLRDLLRDLSEGSPDGFQALSAVVAGAWLLSPETGERIGYPGQGRAPAAVHEGVDELSDGLLDPVLGRGPIYRPTPP